MNFKLSNQAIGAIMMALQKGIMEKIDITEILQNFKIIDSEDGLIVDNPPIFNLKPPEDKEKTTVA